MELEKVNEHEWNWKQSQQTIAITLSFCSYCSTGGGKHSVFLLSAAQPTKSQAYCAHSLQVNTLCIYVIKAIRGHFIHGI